MNEKVRTDPAPNAHERTMLEQWLEYHRTTLWNKCGGLTEEQLKERAIPPSRLSLLGLLRHMTDTERDWFERDLLGRDVGLVYCSEDNPNGDFESLDTVSVEEAFFRFQAECERSRNHMRQFSLDDFAKRRRPNGESVSLRWILMHMIEEYARHNGHADLLRERIDGSTGD